MANAYSIAEGTGVAVSYLPGYVILSYVISAMGCGTTFELLHRRTAMTGVYNWYLLLTSSLTMGGIGIWCMHFIGNRAIVLGDGAKNLQILYSMTFTGVSFALPVCVLLVAFSTVGAGEKAGYFRILAGGFLTGSAVCAMHYVGQLGIANYKCSYQIAHVVGSAIIAIFASTASLGIFFRWRATWTDSWWRRSISALLLAAAVTGMHFTSTTGTSYRDHDNNVNHGEQLSRSQTVIICAVLSCVSCIILLICAIIAGGNRRRSSARAHQLVLSCAFFDPSGRIMVTPEAFLPTRKIVERYIGRTFNDDDLTKTHPAFLWAFRASRNWKLVKDLVPFMKNRLESERAAIRHHVLSKGVIMDRATELQTDFDTLFKQLFCVAAQELADDLRQPLQDLGMLYDNVLATSVHTSGLSKMMMRSPTQGRKGQLIFTVRQVTKQEAARLATYGFRFSPIEDVVSILSRRIHVPVADLGYHLRDMRDYAVSSRNFKPGVHLISFIMRPTIHDHFELLTAKGTGNPLPSSSLPIEHLEIRHMDLISHMDGWSILNCIDWLESDAASAYPGMDDFRRQLTNAMSSLFAALPQDANAATMLYARPLVAPCRGSTQSEKESCILLAFCAIVKLDTQVLKQDLTFTPLRLFRAQQEANDGVFHQDVFSKELTQELFYSNIKSSNTTTEQDSRSMRSTFPLWPRRKHSTAGFSTVSQESLVDSYPFGEIVVRKEVKVDVSRVNEGNLTPQSVDDSQIPRPIVVGSDGTASTYVDELYSVCHAQGARLLQSGGTLPPVSS